MRYAFAPVQSIQRLWRTRHLQCWWLWWSRSSLGCYKLSCHSGRHQWQSL